MDLKEKFEKLNEKRTTNLCCEGHCYNNYIDKDDCLTCGSCERTMHIDNYLMSICGYLCEECEKKGQCDKGV